MRLAAKNTIIFLMIYILGIFCCVFVIPKLASYVPGVIRIGLKSNSPQDIVIGLAYGKNKPYQSVETVEHLSSGEFKNYKIHVPATKIQYIYFKPIHAPATKIQAKRVTFKSIKTGYSTDALKLKDFVEGSRSIT